MEITFRLFTNATTEMLAREIEHRKETERNVEKIASASWVDVLDALPEGGEYVLVLFEGKDDTDQVIKVCEYDPYGIDYDNEVKGVSPGAWAEKSDCNCVSFEDDNMKARCWMPIPTIPKRHKLPKRR